MAMSKTPLAALAALVLVAPRARAEESEVPAGPLVAGGFEAIYRVGGQNWSLGKASLLALPYLALMTWDVWKLAHPIAVAPVISEQAKGIAIAARF